MCNVPERPTFMWGPKDGAPVPEMLWALDEIELQERSSAGILIHIYRINYEDKSYYYAGVLDAKEEQ
jgi:hypothetical protein